MYCLPTRLRANTDPERSKLFPPSLTINLKTGAVGKVSLNGPVTPKGLIFVP